MPPPDKADSLRRTDQQMVPILGQVVVKQNGVIAKCIEQIDSGNVYLEKINQELQTK